MAPRDLLMNQILFHPVMFPCNALNLYLNGKHHRFYKESLKFMKRLTLISGHLSIFN